MANHTYKEAFKKFKEIFLEKKQSIFSDQEILTEPNLKNLLLIIASDENTLEGDASFIQKLSAQAGIKPIIQDSEKSAFPSNKVPELTPKERNDALELLAHAVWLWRLPPYSSKSSKDSRISAVKEILDLTNSQASVDYAEKDGFFDDFAGFASPGMYYYINKHYELLYIVEFFNRYLDNSKKDSDKKVGETALLLGTEKLEPITITPIKAQLNLSKSGRLESFKNESLKSKKITCAMQNALLHLLAPKEYEPILSNAHKERIIKNLEHVLVEATPKKEKNNDEKIRFIRETLEKTPELKDDGKFSFYSKKVRPLWDDNLQPIELNTIYYGPPGTGKTYLARQAIEARVSREASSLGQINELKAKRIKQVQFHPSFTYEDFIDGLKPELTKEGQVNLKLTNGVFKEFCHVAAEKLLEFRQGEDGKDDSKMPMFYFIADEINRADLSSVLGEVLSCLEEDKRLDFDDKGHPKRESLLIQTKNSYLNTTENSDPAVIIKDKQAYFSIPKNLVFVGTMNDIDRSVDTFDFALRRRFTWIYKGFDIDTFTDAESFKDIDGADLQGYVESCQELNKYITKELELGESYAIGHAYFFNIEVSKAGEEFNKSNKGRLFDRHISPLLEEYLRSSFDANDIKAKIKTAKNIFISGKK